MTPRGYSIKTEAPELERVSRCYPCVEGSRKLRSLMELTEISREIFLLVCNRRKFPIARLIKFPRGERVSGKLTSIIPYI